MLIINADDYGRNRLATDRILACHKQQSVTSTSAMVFMDDSERAADLARQADLDVGLHLNFTQLFTQKGRASCVFECQERIVRALTRTKYSFLRYHPALRKQFRCAIEGQLEEFLRLYGVPPTHFDGHHHMHLCSNMLLEPTIPKGEIVRRYFSFRLGEKGLFKFLYRVLVDRWVLRRFRSSDFLFSLSECLRNDRLGRAILLARVANVELQTHPEVSEEFHWLMGDACSRVISNVRKGTFADLYNELAPAT
jgi:hypothetical protein